MEAEPDNKLTELKDRLDSGEYAIDPRAVADAILRRSRDAALVRAELARAHAIEFTADPTVTWSSRPLAGSAGQLKGGQTVCSNPVRRLVASTKFAPGSPWMTRPIQVIRSAGSACATAASTTLRALGGAHAHSS
jgi:hypothetical protein